MVLLNILLPTLCFTFVFTDNSLGLHICLGEGFQSFFSTSMSFCPNDNLFASISCYTLLSVLGFCMSNVIDGYCTFCCAQEIKKSTENTKSMMSNKAYINRTRSDLKKLLMNCQRKKCKLCNSYFESFFFANKHQFYNWHAITKLPVIKGTIT